MIVVDFFKIRVNFWVPIFSMRWPFYQFRSDFYSLTFGWEDPFQKDQDFWFLARFLFFLSTTFIILKKPRDQDNTFNHSRSGTPNPLKKSRKAQALFKLVITLQNQPLQKSQDGNLPHSYSHPFKLYNPYLTIYIYILKMLQSLGVVVWV